jgi:hypothetical protein
MHGEKRTALNPEKKFLFFYMFGEGDNVGMAAS